MQKRRVFCNLVLLVYILVGTPSILLSHGGADHILGTVSEVSQDSMVVTTKNKKMVSIKLTSETLYKPVGKQTTGLTPKVGDRVVVEASNDSGEFSAKEVRFSSIGSSPPK